MALIHIYICVMWGQNFMQNNLQNKSWITQKEYENMNIEILEYAAGVTDLVSELGSRRGRFRN